jgi:hypothetical protein
LIRQKQQEGIVESRKIPIVHFNIFTSLDLKEKVLFNKMGINGEGLAP